MTCDDGMFTGSYRCPTLICCPDNECAQRKLAEMERIEMTDTKTAWGISDQQREQDGRRASVDLALQHAHQNSLFPTPGEIVQSAAVFADFIVKNKVPTTTKSTPS